MIYLIKSPEAKKLENGEYEFFFSLKIGYTDDESADIKKNKRLNTYYNHHRTIEVLTIIPNGTEEQEKRLHYKFRDLRWDNSNEWYIYDQSIIDYFKSATLDEINELDYSPGNSIRITKAKNIVSKIVSSDKEEIDNYVNTMKTVLGKSIDSEDNILNYLRKDKSIDNEKILKYERYKSGNFVEDKISNDKINKFVKNIETLKDTSTKLKYIVDNKNILSKEELNIVLDYLDGRITRYITILGFDGCKACGYNITSMNDRCKKERFNKDVLKNEIYKFFKEGDKISLSKLKSQLKEIYTSLNYKSTPKAKDIEEYFVVKTISTYEKDSDTNKLKKINGYELISKKF